MNEAYSQIKIPHISTYDALGILDELGPESGHFETIPIEDSAHGEIGTALAIVLTAEAIKVIAAYLLRKHKSDQWTEEIEIRRPDGTSFRHTIVRRKESSDPPDTALIHELTNLGDLKTFVSK